MADPDAARMEFGVPAVRQVDSVQLPPFVIDRLVGSHSRWSLSCFYSSSRSSDFFVCRSYFFVDGIIM